MISPGASEATKAVAAELAEHLGRISGAKFEVTAGDGAQGIVLGALAEFPNLAADKALDKALEIRNTYDGKEALVIRTEPKRLLLIGATDLGASHAAFRLLEHLGCRWFFPAKEWEVIPAQKTLNVSFDEADRPRILARRIWYGYGAFSDKGHPAGGSAQKDYQAWAQHNRMAGSFTVHAGHAWQTIIATNKKTFDDHPEYRALVKGVRKGEQLCVSQPEVRRLAAKWALDFFEKNPDREMVSLECSDGDGQCECEACAKRGSVSNRVFGLANEAAKAVAAKYPGKMVGCLAYNQHSEPPDFPLEPNVYVQLTAGFIRGACSFDELAGMWPKKCRNMGFYEYFSVWLWDFDKLPGGKGANIPRIREAVQRYAKLGATSMDAESGNNWGVHGLGYYVANKLMWNPDADVDALLADFYVKAFGPGAQAMRRYYERWAPENSPLMSRGLIGELFRDVDEAARLAKDLPDVLARLDHLKHYLRYNHLRWLLDHEKDKTKQKELTAAILAFAYRTRYEYMTHWAAMRQAFAGDAAKKFDEPVWNVNDKTPKPWMIEQPVTREETAQWFREGLDYFQPTPAQEIKFAYNDLVAAPFADAKPSTLTQSFQRAEKYALASVKGEPLEVEITVGLIAWYRDRPDAKWTLKDAKENLIAEGRQKLDGESHKLTMSVPRAGVYYFECEDAAAGWRINVAPGRPASWLAKRGIRIVPLGQFPEQFFYVPRGTRQLQFFYTGTPCKILGPDRKVIAEVKTNDEIVSVPVPEGADGQVWSLSPRSHTQLWFFNAPNLLAASPSALLLPRELAKKDALP
ncbi:MAG: DUF4838 domain-containing protein [Candidatus Sumerlaeota bacterium]|nr:DUF4838 domain-containing protein [Candidatus Sumerlaeota bacterium]